MTNKRGDSTEEKNGRLKFNTPKRNWKRFDSVVQQRHIRKPRVTHEKRLSGYKVYKPIRTEELPKPEADLSESSNVLKWLDSMIKRGRSVLSTMKEDEKAFDLELQKEARQSLARERDVQSALNGTPEALDATSVINDYGTDTSFKNFNSTLRNSLAESADFGSSRTNEEDVDFDDQASQFSAGGGNSPGSSFAILQDVEDELIARETQSGSGSILDEHQDGALLSGSERSEDGEDIVELISSDDQENLSSEAENEEYGEEESLPGENVVADELITGESQAGADNVILDEHLPSVSNSREETDSEEEKELMYNSDDASESEHSAGHLDVSDREAEDEREVKNDVIQVEVSEGNYQSAELMEMADQMQVVDAQEVDEGINENLARNSPHQPLDESEFDPHALAEEPIFPFSPLSEINIEECEASQSQPQLPDESSNHVLDEESETSLRDTRASTSEVGSATPLAEETEAKRDIDRSDGGSSLNSPEQSSRSDASEGVNPLDGDLCDYKAIANAVMSQIPLQIGTFDVDSEDEKEVLDDAQNITSSKDISLCSTDQATSHDKPKTSEPNSNEDESNFESQDAARMIDAEKNQFEVVNHDHSSRVEERNTSYFHDETTIFHSFVDEETDSKGVDQLPQREQLTRDPKVKIVFSGSVYSSSSFEDDESVAEERPDYVSPLAENPFLSTSVESNILKRTLASLEQRTHDRSSSIDRYSASSAGKKAFKTENTPGEPKAWLPMQSRKKEEGEVDEKASKSSLMTSENFGPFAEDFKLHGGLQTRDSSVTFLSNAVPARDETASLGHNKSSQFDGQSPSNNDVHGNLSHLKEEEISEYLSAVLEASGRIEDRTSTNESLTEFFVEEIQSIDIGLQSLIKTEPIVELSDALDRSSNIDAVQESHHDLTIIGETIEDAEYAVTSNEEVVITIKTQPIIELPSTAGDIWLAQRNEKKRDGTPRESEFYDEGVASRKRSRSELAYSASVNETLAGARQTKHDWSARVSEPSDHVDDFEIEDDGTLPFLKVLKTTEQISTSKRVILPPSQDSEPSSDAQAVSSLSKKLISSPVRAVSSLIFTGMKEVGSIATSFAKSLDLMDLDDDDGRQASAGEHSDRAAEDDQTPTLSDFRNSPDFTDYIAETSATKSHSLRTEFTNTSLSEKSDAEADTVKSGNAGNDEGLARQSSGPEGKDSCEAVVGQNMTINDIKGVFSAQDHSEAAEHSQCEGDTSDGRSSGALDEDALDADGGHLERVAPDNSNDDEGVAHKSEVLGTLTVPVVLNAMQRQEDPIYVEIQSSSQSGENSTSPPSETHDSAGSVQYFGNQNIGLDEGQDEGLGGDDASLVESTANNNEIISDVRALQSLAQNISNILPTSTNQEDSSHAATSEDLENARLPSPVRVDPEIQIEIDQTPSELNQADLMITKERDNYPVESTVISELGSKNGNNNDSELLKRNWSEPKVEITAGQPRSASTANFERHTLPANLPSDPPSDNSAVCSEGDEEESDEEIAPPSGNSDLQSNIDSESEREEDRKTRDYNSAEAEKEQEAARPIPVKFDSKASDTPVPVTVQDKDLSGDDSSNSGNELARGGEVDTPFTHDYSGKNRSQQQPNSGVLENDEQVRKTGKRINMPKKDDRKIKKRRDAKAKASKARKNILRRRNKLSRNKK